MSAPPPPSAPGAAHPPHPAAPAPSTPSTPSTPANFIGSLISLVTRSHVRYTGVLTALDVSSQTVSLQHVRCHGTEGRCGGGEGELQGSEGLYEFVVFRAGDVKDLNVERPPPAHQAYPNDPAIVNAYARQDAPLQRPPGHASGPRPFPPQLAPGPAPAQAYPAPAHFHQGMLPQQADPRHQGYSQPAPQGAPAAVPAPPPVPQQQPVALSPPVQMLTTAAPSQPRPYIVKQPSIQPPADASKPADQVKILPTVPTTGPTSPPKPAPVFTHFAPAPPQSTKAVDALPKPVNSHPKPVNAQPKPVEAQPAPPIAPIRAPHPKHPALEEHEHPRPVSHDASRGGQARGRGRGQRTRSHPNRANSVPDGEYDFEAANARFTKQYDLATTPPNLPVLAEDTVKPVAKKPDFYNPKASFFDNISCESKEKLQQHGDGKRGRGGNARHMNERRVNLETFGATLPTPNTQVPGVANSATRGRGGYRNERGGRRHNQQRAIPGGGIWANAAAS